MKLCFIPQKLYMQAAIENAQLAEQAGEVPVGAVLVFNDEIFTVGRNRRESIKNAIGHAEIEAIYRACHARKDWRLSDCDLYVTLEPCPMCMGAILNARIKRVIFGAVDNRVGCCGTALDMRPLDYYRYPEIYPGFMEEECRQLLKDFFIKLR